MIKGDVKMDATEIVYKVRNWFVIFYIRQLHFIIKTNFLNTHSQPMIFTKSPQLTNRLHVFSDMRRQS